MPRIGKPWYKASHKCWYAKIGGKLTRLATDFEQAQVVYAAMVGKVIAAPKSSPGGLNVQTMVQAYLADATRRMSPRTVEVMRYSLGLFVESFGSLPASEIKGHDLIAWSLRQGWGPASQRTYVGHCRMLYRWAVDLGYIEQYRFSRLKLPAMPRTETITDAQETAFLNACHLQEVRDYWTIGLACGGRPEELRTLRACDVSPDMRTGSVVGKQGKRPVWFATTGQEALQRLVTANPSGPILRGTRGQPWLKTALEECHRRISRKIGVVVTPKQTRKRFATKCIAAGISPAIVAKLLGHKSYDMTMRHYVGFEQQTLINVLDRLV